MEYVRFEIHKHLFLFEFLKKKYFQNINRPIYEYIMNSNEYIQVIYEMEYIWVYYEFRIFFFKEKTIYMLSNLVHYIPMF